MTDKVREEFEAWAADEGLSIAKVGSGDYCNRITCAAWKAWKASRAAMASHKDGQDLSPLTYQGRPCRHCGGRERYRSNQSCVNYRRCAPTQQQKLNKERARLRKEEFLR